MLSETTCEVQRAHKEPHVSGTFKIVVSFVTAKVRSRFKELFKRLHTKAARHWNKTNVVIFVFLLFISVHKNIGIHTTYPRVSCTSNNRNIINTVLL